MSSEQLKALTEWPTKAEDVTVDLILRIVGAETQRLWLSSMDALYQGIKDRSGAGYMRSPLYMAQTQALISSVGLMSCLRALRSTNAEAANEFARDYWSMCNAGDSFGELLWEFTEEAGLDPGLIKP